MCVMHIMQISRHLQFIMARARGYTLAPATTMSGDDARIPAGVPTHRLDTEDLEEEARRWQPHLLGREELEDELRVLKELLVSVMREHQETKRQLAMQQELWTAHQHWLATLCGSVWDQQEWMRQNRPWSSTGQLPFAPPTSFAEKPPPPPVVPAKAPPQSYQPPPPPYPPWERYTEAALGSSMGSSSSEAK